MRTTGHRSRLLRSVQRQFLTDVSGKPIGKINTKKIFFDFLTLEGVIDRLSRNVGKNLPLLAA